MSPFCGEFSTPKLKTLIYGDKMITEAHWYCPRTGKFITKGTVKVEDRQYPGSEPKK